VLIVMAILTWVLKEPRTAEVVVVDEVPAGVKGLLDGEMERALPPAPLDEGYLEAQTWREQSLAEMTKPIFARPELEALIEQRGEPVWIVLR